jgi:hypothetical protein
MLSLCHYYIKPYQKSQSRHFQLDRPANGKATQHRPSLRIGKLTVEKKKPSETLAERFRGLEFVFISNGYLPISDTAMLFPSMLTALSRTIIRFGHFFSCKESRDHTAVHDIALIGVATKC